MKLVDEVANLMRWTPCMLREIILVGCSYLDIIDTFLVSLVAENIYKTTKLIQK
jgi:hypothetical protein